MEQEHYGEERELDFYDEEYLEELRQADGINGAQEGFMVGYLADDL